MGRNWRRKKEKNQITGRIIELIKLIELRRVSLKWSSWNWELKWKINGRNYSKKIIRKKNNLQYCEEWN